MTESSGAPTPLQPPPPIQASTDSADLARSSRMIRVLAAWIAAVMVITFITVPWLKAGSGGDFSPSLIWFYHAIMIPSAILFLLLCMRSFPIHPWARYVVTGGASVALFSSVGLLVRGYGLLEHSASVAAIGVFIVVPADFVLFMVTIVFLIGLGASTIAPLSKTSLSRRKIEITWALLLFGISAVTWIVFGMAYAASEVGISWGFWASWQKEHLSALLGNLVTSHSHGMLPAFMGGIVVLAAETFGYSRLRGVRAQLARIGVGIMLAGVALFSAVYFVSALGTYSIPTLFPFGPHGVNGLAMDDTMTSLVGLGTLVLVSAMLPELREGPGKLGARLKERFNPVRAGVYLSYVVAAFVMFVYGYYIEMNESRFGFGAMPAARAMNDQIFTRSHLLFVFGALPVMAVLLLAVELSGKVSEMALTLRRWVSAAMALGMVVTLIGMSLWVFSAPGHSPTWAAGSAGEVLYILGQCLMLVGALIEVLTLRSGGAQAAPTLVDAQPPAVQEGTSRAQRRSARDAPSGA